MVLATRRIKPNIFSLPVLAPTVPTQTSGAPDFFGQPDFPEEVYEPTAEGEDFISEELNAAYEAEETYQASLIPTSGHHSNGYPELTQEEADEMRLIEAKFTAEYILERVGGLSHLRYVSFVSKSKGRYRSGNKAGQKKPRRGWIEVELVSRGVEPTYFIGGGYRHRVFWPSSKFPWDEAADGMGITERGLMSLLPTLAQNAKEARRYLLTGKQPDYRKPGVVNY
ncbi:MAG: hypothetical protein HY516_02020 [Candidatus Aenigmarchaeota archaeon]|nr:hypothetical protein [Candidatus Aenigmarchaeota archaeon]